ncbi:uncharacterized protein EI90DRAFT_2895810, partial [Cantharellus anzutake]|uniref:uncharacterized protein n=1 Tax=Cantharellus anzutake TaxID=1750568 RepID=UPI00190801B0
WVMVDASRGPVPLPNESFYTFIPSADVTVKLRPEVSGGTAHTLRQTGTIHISNQRLVFIADKATPQPESSLDTISIPPLAITSTSFLQPWFSANYLNLTLGRPVEGGGITSGSTIEVRLNDRGLFQFVEIVERMRAQAV